MYAVDAMITLRQSKVVGEERKKASTSNDGLTPKRNRKDNDCGSLTERFHGEITNDRIKSQLKKKNRADIVTAILKYFPPTLRSVTALSIPMDILHEAATLRTSLTTRSENAAKVAEPPLHRPPRRTMLTKQCVQCRRRNSFMPHSGKE